ncbi:GAF and ANTAR domain-containing protein [Kribbella sandramycini]|uniref:GAF and ANTAR domain-containing protein n=1 Tax=Kribbella sandramycini TaxID=60450 RepID=A0A7Y4L6X1_9ACTN|nr:GAF and ANTAR domain-containing protein [Kribbella sandramycini]
MDLSRADHPAEADPSLDATVPTIDPNAPTAADAFARLAVELHEAPGVEETLQAVIDFALQAESSSHAGVVLTVRSGRAEIGAVTDPAIEELYRLQIDSDAGPLITALETRAVLVVQDIADDTEWPAWRDKALELGIRSVLHVPMVLGNRPIGALSPYNEAPDSFSADDEAIAHILARHASVAVASARQEENMAAAVDARKLVGQAMGILMERFDVDGDRAFAILRRYSQDNNRKLRDVAQELIDTRKLPRSQ